MSHVRIFNHYVNEQFLVLGILEAGLLVASVYLGNYLKSLIIPLGAFEFFTLPRPSAIALFSITMMLAMMSMGVYRSKVREGLSGMALRSIVALFLLGFSALSAFSYMAPDLRLHLGRGVLVFATITALVCLIVFRWFYFRAMGEELLERKILVIGAGRQAQKLIQELASSADRDLVLHTFVRIGQGDVLVTDCNVTETPASLRDYIIANDIEEVVVAVDDRRRVAQAENDFPLAQLLECKLSGIRISDAVSFIERETGKIEPRNLSPGWMIFSEGFGHSPFRDHVQRLFDLAASFLLLMVSWPLMLLTVIAIKLEDGVRAPVFYSQTRVGLNGKVFKVHKFRSMRTDAEKFGAAWAQENDPRITRVGKFIRNVRIDELPQIFNVLKGDMSFVGPRPERPEFVEKLAQNIPYFDERHRVKPGITGWAQLCYPYGASDEDSEQKLKYDLYYVKNRSLLLDLLILIQTVEVVLIGKGVR